MRQSCKPLFGRAIERTPRFTSSLKIQRISVIPRRASVSKPQDAKSRNKGRTASGHQLCYFLVEMNALTDLLAARATPQRKTITDYSDHYRRRRNEIVTLIRRVDNVRTMEMCHEDIHRCSRVDVADRQRIAHSDRKCGASVPGKFRIRQ